MRNLKRGGNRINSGREKLPGFANPVPMRFESEREWLAMEQFTPRQRVQRILTGRDDSDILLEAIQDLADRLERIEQQLKSGIIYSQAEQSTDGLSAWQAMEDFE